MLFTYMGLHLHICLFDRRLLHCHVSTLYNVRWGVDDGYGSVGLHGDAHTPGHLMVFHPFLSEEFTHFDSHVSNMLLEFS